MEDNIDLILVQLHIEEEQFLLLALAGLTFVQAQQGVPRRRRQRRRRRWWIKPYLRRRPLFGQYEIVKVELYRENREDYKTFIMINPYQFQEFVVRRRPDMAASFFTWKKRP